MGLRPIQGDEELLLLVLSSVPHRSVIPIGVAQWRDLQFRGPLLEMFFDRSKA